MQGQAFARSLARKPSEESRASAEGSITTREEKLIFKSRQRLPQNTPRALRPPAAAQALRGARLPLVTRKNFQSESAYGYRLVISNVLLRADLARTTCALDMPLQYDIKQACDAKTLPRTFLSPNTTLESRHVDRRDVLQRKAKVERVSRASP